MAEMGNAGLVKIRRALISVSDKTGIVDFARELRRFNVEIISTGGTARVLRDAGIEVRDVSEITGFPGMLDGRVKTLHPRIHAGLLAVRDNPEHIKALREQGVEPIDMVVVNLYPFEETAAREGVTLEEAMEQIDIGGPAMIRAAAKNWKDVAVITSHKMYPQLIDQMNREEGSLSLDSRAQLAKLAFLQVGIYDSAIFAYLERHLANEARYGSNFYPSADEVMKTLSIYIDLIPSAVASETPELAKAVKQPESREDELADYIGLYLDRLRDLRYGENPHQSAALYVKANEQLAHGVACSEQLSGKEMSFNNYVDADAAWQLVYDFDQFACAIIKHTNPAGAALGTTAEEAYRKALACDPVSAFGGIVAFNGPVDQAAARALIEIFVEVIIAPDYDGAALEVLKTKKNLRVLRAGESRLAEQLEYRQISGGMLVQTRDTHRLKREELKVVTGRAPTEKEIDDLLFAWTVCKHTRSNAIVYARDGQTVGVGAGQMSRVDSVKIGAMRAQLPIEGSVMASDAFFPFRDGIDEAAKQGITAVIQPGGSIRDQEVITAADEHNLAMIFTGVRHFRH